jgi:DNA repair protein SbcD/Mre11
MDETKSGRVQGGNLMPGRPFQFVHASDLHLEQPAGGLTDAPEHLRERLLECPYLAAARVFDIVLSERADFLVLSGDVLHPWTAGPRGVLFLVEQFTRLRERNIPVYWAGSAADAPENWPVGVPLPDNVHVFPGDRVERFACARDAGPLACVIGRSHGRQPGLFPAEFRSDPAGLFTVAVAHGDADPTALAHSDVDYWALGGRHAPDTPFASRRLAHYCGSPQGRHPEETGTHGCTLVSVDADGHARISHRTTDVLRYCNEHVELPETAGRQTLEAVLDDRLLGLAASSPGADLLVRWTVSGASPALGQLRRDSLANELLERLRREFGHGTPAAWSVSITAEPPDTLPAHCYEHDSLLGDYLRAIRRYQIDESLPIELTDYLADREREEALRGWGRLDDLGDRRRVLRRAAVLGIDLLTGEVTGEGARV